MHYSLWVQGKFSSDLPYPETKQMCRWSCSLINFPIQTNKHVNEYLLNSWWLLLKAVKCWAFYFFICRLKFFKKRAKKLLAAINDVAFQVTPSAFIQKMLQSTEERLNNTTEVNPPRILEWFDMSNTLHQKVSASHCCFFDLTLTSHE